MNVKIVFLNGDIVEQNRKQKSSLKDSLWLPHGSLQVQAPYLISMKQVRRKREIIINYINALTETTVRTLSRQI